VQRRDPESALHVAIVGMGPRGLSVFERLLVRLCAQPPSIPVVIWAIEPVEHGPGRVWRTDQPGWLTMNATAGEVTVLSPDNHVLDPSAPVAAPSFAQWTAGARRAGLQLQSADYPERGHYGSYLREMFDHLRARVPASVQVHRVRGTATGLHRADGGRWLTVEPGQRRLRVDKVVLATGHADLVPSHGEQELHEHAERHRGLRYVGQGLVTEMALSAIPPGATVAVRGLGLTFYDVLRSLTLGRGGRFHRASDGGLYYLPSGREPMLCAGSRGALPFLARGRVVQPPQTAPTPVALTTQWLAALRAAAVAARGTPQLDFAVEVEPLIRLEMDYAYYTCMAQLCSGKRAARRFAVAYRGLLDDGQPPDPGAIREVLVTHGLENVPRVGFHTLARPFDGRDITGREDFRRRLVHVLHRDVAESRKEPGSSPRKAALEALRALRPALPSVVDFGGLLPDSHRDFLDRWVPMSLVLSAGPPASHVEQLLALLAAGVLEVVGPAATFSADRVGGCFTVESQAVPGSRRRAQVMLEARVPTTDLRRDTAPLVRQLLADGMITEFVNTGPPDHDAFHTGGLAVTPTPSRVLDADGHPDPDLYAIGVAIEHTRWFTQVGTGRPHRGSPFCRDADAIVLDVLAAMHQ
jgi:FAD-NAD(P)-binding